MLYFKMSILSELDDKGDMLLDMMGNLDVDDGFLVNVYYLVFGFGFRVYLNFCVFVYFVDNMINFLGGMRINKMMEGDEFCG